MGSDMTAHKATIEDKVSVVDFDGDNRFYNEDGEPTSMQEWAQTKDKWQLKTEIDHQTVSTVWVGINHQLNPDKPPLIFETIIFTNNPEYDGWQARYSTKQQATEGHAAAVSLISRVTLIIHHN